MVHMLEINFGIDTRFPGSIKEVGNQGEWITVFDGDLVESTEINAESKTTIFLLDKEDRCSMRRTRRADHSGV